MNAKDYGRQGYDGKRWIFVSHASADLGAVRQVRNYLEAAGASPLLFHLKSLARPDQFWPIIEREVRARNFFLYCESEAAQRSDWVRRERALVEKLSKSHPRRVGHIRVDTNELDLACLDSLLAHTRVYISTHVSDDQIGRVFEDALQAHGFQINRVHGEEFNDEAQTSRATRRVIEEAAKVGWVVFLLTRRFVERPPLRDLMVAQQHGARIMPVLLEPVDRLSLGFLHFAEFEILDLSKDRRSAPQRLAHELLGRQA